MNAVLDKLASGEVLLGLGYQLPAAGIIEGTCRGWDFVWIDGQHGQYDCRSALEAIRAACAMGVETVLRVPSVEDGELIRYLDADPSVLMVPMVNSVEEARRLVRAAHFPPLGERSYGGRRMVDLYGRGYPSLRRQAVMAQIETPRAVQAARQIIALEGIDLLFFGADDVKMAMQIDIDKPVGDSTPLKEAMAETAQAARAAGKFAGCIAGNEETLRLAMGMGYQLIVAGADAGLLRAAAASLLTAFRRAVGGK